MFSCVNIVEFGGLFLRVLKLYRKYKVIHELVTHPRVLLFCCFYEELGLGFIAGL